MRHLFFSALILISSSALFAQKIKVEARDGKTVIVRTDTLESGEITELAEWKAAPRDVLQKELNEVKKDLEWLDGKLERLQKERKEKRQKEKHIEKAIYDLDNGLFIDTGLPDEKTAPVGTETPAPKKKPAKKPTKSKKQ